MVNPLNILLVDDDHLVRKFQSLILRLHGHFIETAADGAEALEVLRAQRIEFDVILTDHQMPHLGGLGLVRGLATTPFIGSVIVWTGRVTPEEREEYKRLGVLDILIKPICGSDLEANLVKAENAKMEARRSLAPGTASQSKDR